MVIALVAAVIVVLVAVGLALSVWFHVASMVAQRERAYPIPAPHSRNGATNEEKTLDLESRQAVTDSWLFDVALAQLSISILGIAGLGITAVYAHAAFVQARRSADAAERVLTSIERPWLFLDGATVTRRTRDLSKPNEWFINLKWKNLGRMPALIEECIILIQPREGLAEQPDYNGYLTLNCQRSVGADGDFETSEIGPGSAKMDAKGQTIQYVVYGRLVYAELDGTRHETGYALEVSPHLPCHMPYWRKAYEYYK